MEDKDSQKDNSEKSNFEKPHSEESHAAKPKYEKTTTSRQESVAIEVKDILEYQNFLYGKQKKLFKADNKLKKEAKKLDNKKRSDVLFRQNYLVFAVADDAEPFEYDDPETRNKFVAKVFLIVFCLLLVNALVAFAVRFMPNMKEVLEENIIAVIVICSIALIIIVVIHVGMCYFSYMSKPPCTWVNLMLAFMCYNVLLSMTTLIFHTILILVAIGSTAFVVLVCFLLALTKIDFTKYLMVALVMVAAGVMGLLALGGLRAAGYYLPAGHMAALVFLILATSFMLIVQMQMVLGGKSVEFGENDLALPSLMIYTSIITLLLQILRLLRETGLFGDSDFFSSD